MELLAALLTAFSVMLLLLWVFGGHRRDIAQRLARLDPNRLAAERKERSEARFALVGRAAGSLGRRLLGMLPVSWVAGLRSRLAAAGRPITPAGYVVLTLVLTGLSVGFVVVVVGPLAGMGTGYFWLIIGAALGLGLYLPYFWISRTIRARREKVLSQLPDGLDLMTACVEAGLGLDSAMSQVAAQVGGPLSEELQVTLSEIALGRARAEALSAMSDRVQLPELASFVQALNQADQLGMSLGSVLRVQSDVMRTKHRQRVEQLVYQAPVKMLFPLVFLIFPAMFVVILGSAFIELKDGIFGG